MVATDDMLRIPAMGASMVKVGIGVMPVEGTPEAATGLNLNIPPNLMFSMLEVKDTAPLMNIPLSLLAVTELGPLANIASGPLTYKKVGEPIVSFIIFILFSCEHD